MVVVCVISLIIIQLISILKLDRLTRLENYMKIYRNGKEIVLTDEEIMEAHAEHIKSFMRNELITVYGLPEEEAEDYAELAYSHYTSGNG